MKSLLQRSDKRLHPLQGLVDVLDRIGVGDPREALPRRAEGDTGDDGTLMLIEELFAEGLAGQSELADVGVDVEGSLGLEGLDAGCRVNRKQSCWLTLALPWSGNSHMRLSSPT